MPQEPVKQEPQRDALGRMLPGHTANPHGRPPAGESRAETVRRWEENYTRAQLRKFMRSSKGPDGAPLMAKDAAAIKWILDQFLDGFAARAGVQALSSLADRLDGKPRQAVEHMGEGGGPIRLLWDDGTEA